MQIETILILLLVMLVGYMVLTYKKLMKYDVTLEKLREELKDLEDKGQNTDRLRREHNIIARSFNHTITLFIGKRIAKKKGYSEVDIIEKG